MPTKNRRVATYLPQEISASFEAFKVARDIDGDSQALITILSEFLGVSQQVAHSVNSAEYVTKAELEALSAKVAHLIEQMQNIDGFAERAVKKLLGEPSSELPKEESVSEDALEQPKQPKPLEADNVINQEDGLADEGWLSSREAWELLQPPNCTYEAFRKYSAEKLSQRFGLQAASDRKTPGKYNPKWLKMPSTAETQGELLSESTSEPPTS